MDASLYDVYLTGKLANDVTPVLAAQRLAALFKSTPEAMAGLITGKAQLLKRGLDHNTAQKYRNALQNAGCEVALKAQAATPASGRPVAAQPMPGATSSQAQPATATAALQLAPTGEELLRADERRPVAATVIDTAHLSVAPVGPLPAIAATPIAAPDTSHLSLAAAGGNLLQEAEKNAPPAITPDISDLSLAAVGAPIDTLKNEAPPLHPDISALSLLPPGSDMLTAEERRHPQPPAPNTDHFALAP